jgi:hypothetical protein
MIAPVVDEIATEFAGKLTPNNINYVWGFDDAQPQQWLPPGAFLAVWMAALGLLIYTPTHLVLRRLKGPSR